jgi:hypothetical protein
MPKKSKETGNSAENDALLKKVLILELFKLGIPQAEIGKKLKMNLTAVNAFLKGCKKSQ